MREPALCLIHDVALQAPHPLGRGDLLLGGGRILAIGHDLALSGVDCARIDCMRIDCMRIDGRDLIAAPGLVDSLVHIGGGGGEGGFATRTAPLRAEDALAAGVTTLIGALGTDDVTRSHADLLACARALGASGLSAYALTGSYRVPVCTLTGCVRDDLVLVPDVIGVGEIAIADHRGSQPSVEELARIAADARVGGMLAGKAGTVLVHVGDADDGLAPLEAVSARHPLPRSQWLPTHVNRHAALLAHGERWAKAGGTVDFTTSTTPELIADGEVPAAEAVARLLAAGVPLDRITLSSDGQASLPQFDADGRLLALDVAPIASLLDGVRALVREHGLSLGDALTAATATPARVWGLPRKGRLAVGADADVLLLDRDDLRLRATIAGGRLYPFA
ncbi:MAG: beta-aspartyl-peptidase [Lysobacteraceae bacterium]